MQSLREQLRRVRWLTFPLTAYIFVTLVLPAANGAARRVDFAIHALWVLGCCAAIVGIFVLVPTFAHLVRPSLWRKR
jgi:hypothetical protein